MCDSRWQRASRSSAAKPKLQEGSEKAVVLCSCQLVYSSPRALQTWAALVNLIRCHCFSRRSISWSAELLSAAAFWEEKDGSAGGGSSCPCGVAALEGTRRPKGSSVHQGGSPWSSCPHSLGKGAGKWESWEGLLRTWPWRKELKRAETPRWTKEAAHRSHRKTGLAGLRNLSNFLCHQPQNSYPCCLFYYYYIGIYL